MQRYAQTSLSRFDGPFRVSHEGWYGKRRVQSYDGEPMKRRSFLQMIGVVAVAPFVPRIETAAKPIGTITLSDGPDKGTYEWKTRTSRYDSDTGKKLDKPAKWLQLDADAVCMAENMRRTLDDVTKKAVLGEL